MNKVAKGILITVLVLGVAYFLALKYFNSGSKTPDNTVWYEYIGRDTTVGLWPDVYANYFAYTFIRTHSDLGLKITGEFPNTRYMSYNVYNLQTKTTQGSIVDNEIIASIPFEIDGDRTGDSYEVNVLPKKHENLDLPNKLIIQESDKVLLVVQRLYDFNEDDYGGVELPHVQAFDASEVEAFTPVNLPKGINLRKFVKAPEIAEDIWYMYEAENLFSLDGPRTQQKYHTVPFFRVIGEGMIQNNDNLYLLSAITKKPDEIYFMRFRSPSYVKTTSDIGQTDVRYWSVNIGDDLSYVFNAVKDEDCIIDEEGYVTIVIGEKDAQLESKVKELGFNYLEWNVPRDRGFIIYRNMLTHPDFEGHILQVPPLKDKGESAFSGFEAGDFIGEYAPQGYRMSKDEFLKEFE